MIIIHYGMFVSSTLPCILMGGPSGVFPRFVLTYRVMGKFGNALKALLDSIGEVQF